MASAVDVFGGAVLRVFHLEGESMSIIKERANKIANSVDWERVGFDPASILAIITMVSTLLETVLPALAQCLHFNDDVTPSTAQGRVRAMYAKNPSRLFRRTKNNVVQRNKKAARKDPSIKRLTDQQADALTEAILEDAMNEESSTEFQRTFAACCDAANAYDGE